MGFLDAVYSLIKWMLILAVIFAILLAALYFANEHVRAKKKARAQEKAKFRQSVQPQGLSDEFSPKATTTNPVSPSHRTTPSLTPTSEQTINERNAHGNNRRTASVMLNKTKEAVKHTFTSSSSSTDHKPGGEALSKFKRGMRKRLASFKQKQAPKIKEQMSLLGFEASFNPMFEAGFAQMENMVFEDPTEELREDPVKANAKKDPSKAKKAFGGAIAAPVLAGAYALDSLARRKSVKPEEVEEEDEDEHEVIWLEGMLGKRPCWEDIDTGELVFERPLEGTITNQETLDNMMKEPDSTPTQPKFSESYLAMRAKFKVAAPLDLGPEANIRRNSTAHNGLWSALEGNHNSGGRRILPGEDEEEDEDVVEEEEEEEGIRQMDHRDALGKMLGS